MPAPDAKSGRTVVEPVIGAAVALACIVVVALGAATWAATFLQAAYPCGETYLDHPSCRLRDPGAVALGRLLVLAVPALCTVGAVVAGTVGLVRRRRGALPTAPFLVVALMAFLIGRTVLVGAVLDVVPW